MPKQTAKLTLDINILKPQGIPRKPLTKFISWLLSTGRYLIIFVELLVLAAFIARFKLDADLEVVKEKVNAQIPYLESFKQTEEAIRQTQFQLATIKNLRGSTVDYTKMLKKISDQVPQGAKIENMNLEKAGDRVNFKITGSVQNNNELTTFLIGLKEDKNFSNIDLAGIGLEQGLISFTISGQYSK